jgi:hypothetical protein
VEERPAPPDPEEERVKRLWLALAPLVVAGAAFAETGFQFAVPEVNLPSDPNVRGVRLSLLHGENQSTRGVDFGILSYSETSRASGVAFIAGVHHVKQAMSNGAAFSLVNYHEGSDSGLNWAFVNVLKDASHAFDLGFVTYTEGPTLIDLGGINISRRSTVQIGFLNMTDHLTSFQFGFLNMADNGFLPIFPVFNFPKSK